MKKFGFLRHHRMIRIEGYNLPNIVNKCIKNGITLKELTWKSPIESTVSLEDEDYIELKKLSGHSYRMTTIGEGGMIPFFKKMKTNIVTIIGAFLLGAFIFYQSLFIAEINVDGYESITEEEIRQTLKETGVYEGARKPDDYDLVKSALYENHSRITWISIFEEGRLIKVNIAEAGKEKEAEVKDTAPVNIVAEKSGMIEKIVPLQGNAKVQKGDYVNEGDVLISGKYEYQSSDYSRGDDFYIMYSHAEGQVYAMVPRQVDLYVEKTERIKKLTGRRLPGIYIKIGGMEIDTAGRLNRYEASVRNEIMPVDILNPLPLKIGLVWINEVRLQEERWNEERLRNVTEAAIRQYERDELGENESIVSYSIDYSESENLIKAGVFMEVLEDIGVDKPIKVRKEKKTEKST